MTRALAKKSDEVQPAAKRHWAETDTIQQAFQLIAERLRWNAIDANKIALAPGDEAMIETDIDVTALEGHRR